MGYKPSGYQEIFVKRSRSGGKIDMISRFPGSSDPTLELEEGDEVVNKSEMMVRYI
jgi:hypothetical protein